MGEVPVAEGEVAPDGQNSRLGLAVDKEVADKLREKASEASKQPVIKPQAGKSLPADKSVTRGAPSFSEQLVVARGGQDPLVTRIAQADADEPPRRP